MNKWKKQLASGKRKHDPFIQVFTEYLLSLTLLDMGTQGGERAQAQGLSPGMWVILEPRERAGPVQTPEGRSCAPQPSESDGDKAPAMI